MITSRFGRARYRKNLAPSIACILLAMLTGCGGGGGDGSNDSGQNNDSNPVPETPIEDPLPPATTNAEIASVDFSAVEDGTEMTITTTGGEAELVLSISTAAVVESNTSLTLSFSHAGDYPRFINGNRSGEAEAI